MVLQTDFNAAILTVVSLDDFSRWLRREEERTGPRVRCPGLPRAEDHLGQGWFATAHEQPAQVHSGR